MSDYSTAFNAGLRKGLKTSIDEDEGYSINSIIEANLYHVDKLRYSFEKEIHCFNEGFELGINFQMQSKERFKSVFDSISD